jgi:hypothetical protein
LATPSFELDGARQLDVEGAIIAPCHAAAVPTAVEMTIDSETGAPAWRRPRSSA